MRFFNSLADAGKAPAAGTPPGRRAMLSAAQFDVAPPGPRSIANIWPPTGARPWWAGSGSPAARPACRLGCPPRCAPGNPERERGRVMNTGDEGVNPAMNDALPVAARPATWPRPSRFYDGELVDDLPDTARRAVVRRFATWWARSVRLPAALTSRQALRQATRDLIAWVVRSTVPVRRCGQPRDRGGGARVASVVRVHDYRDADEQAEKLADKFIEIRALTLFRLKANAAAIRAGAAAVIVLDLVYGTGALWITDGARQPLGGSIEGSSWFISMAGPAVTSANASIRSKGEEGDVQ